MSRARFVAPVLLCVALGAHGTVAQEPAGSTYSRLNTFSGFGEYSNDSSHIILGIAENRKIGAIGFQYQRRLVHRRPLDLSFTVEARPGMLESDPVQTLTLVQTEPDQITNPQSSMPVKVCHSGILPYSFTISYPNGPVLNTGYNIVACSRRTVIEQGLSPAGVRINLMPQRRLQLTFSSFAGYMFATQQVPVPDAGSFNYTFEFGGGLEFFQTHTRSMRLEYQVQHFSNKYTADLNPGVDSGFIKLTYAFGR